MRIVMTDLDTAEVTSVAFVASTKVTTDYLKRSIREGVLCGVGHAISAVGAVVCGVLCMRKMAGSIPNAQSYLIMAALVCLVYGIGSIISNKICIYTLQKSAMFGEHVTRVAYDMTRVCELVEFVRAGEVVNTEVKDGSIFVTVCKDSTECIQACELPEEMLRICEGDDVLDFTWLDDSMVVMKKLIGFKEVDYAD